MKNQISKSVKFSALFGLFLILMFSASVFSQENKEPATICNIDKSEDKKKDEKKPLKLEDCEEKDFDCKIDYFSEKIAKSKDDKFICDSCDYRVLRGVIYYEKGKYTDALTDFNFAIKNEKYSSSYEVYLYRGKIYEKQGNYDAALSDYLKFQSDQGLLGIGNIYRYKREYEKSLNYYNKAIERNYRLAKAYFGRAVIYLELGKVLTQSDLEEDKAKTIQYFKDALKDLDSVIEIDLLATEPETYLRRSQVYRQLGETEKADADFQKYNELDNAPKLQT